MTTRIGIATGYDPALTVRDFARTVHEVDERGYDIAFFSETFALMRDSVSAMAAFALASQRITLGCTQVVRLRSPVTMAQTLASLDELSGGGDPLIEVIGGAGIRLHTYLPTRTFELAAHGLDIARAVGISFQLPADVLEEATALAARIAVAEAHGETVLLALTGRTELPSSFSIV